MVETCTTLPAALLFTPDAQHYVCVSDAALHDEKLEPGGDALLRWAPA
jgi:hypothetical protein